MTIDHFPNRLETPRLVSLQTSHFASDLARRRRRVRERLQKIMAELARERRRLPDAGG